MSRLHLAILITHPIQYLAPWFRALSEQPDLDVEVLICHDARPAEQADAGFGVEFAWDRPLLEGYEYRFLHNVARNPSIHGFRGLDTPELGSIIAAGRFD
ncbi:MAG: glycosyltransferase family 1 protein, partial [Chloroflexi bacterium]|nr:glycosyltransferase family 1 protein [Chloroflexota bacterium]